MEPTHKPTDKWSLRPVTEEDIPGLVEIERRVQKAPWTRENFSAEIAKPYSTSLVLTDDETDSKLAGYVVYWMMFDECNILNIAVDLPYQRRGMAKQMLRKSIDEAIRNSIKKILLDVRKSNSAAQSLYQQLGFVVTHIRRSFYSDGEDAYQMALFLTEDSLKF